MHSGNRYHGVDEYAVRIIKRKARQLVGRVGFAEGDVEDLEQEMVLDLLRRLSDYNPQRAKRNTFIVRIVDHKVATIVEARKAQKRDYRRCTRSLNERIEKRNGDVCERIDTVNQDEYLRRTRNLSLSTLDLKDLSLDLRRIGTSLPPKLRTLYNRLRTQTVSEVSRDTGIPRGTIYDNIKKLRGMLEKAGLKDYL